MSLSVFAWFVAWFVAGYIAAGYCYASLVADEPEPLARREANIATAAAFLCGLGALAVFLQNPAMRRHGRRYPWEATRWHR